MTTLAPEVADAKVVGRVETVVTADTDWILATTWDGRLALVGLDVVVVVGLALESSVLSV